MATRKIKDAKDLSTNELIYFKGHAQATYMSDGRTVEDAINNIDISGGGEIPLLAAVATSGDYNDLKNKPTIPNAVTESTVSGWGFTKNTGTITGVSANGTSVATSGVANIPAATTSKYGVTKLTSATNSTSTTLAATASAVKSAYDLANGKYTKPSTGIPFSDFEEQVQGSIIKAEEAVQGVSMSVTTGNATAGNFFNVNKDANGNVSIQMIQNTLASGKIAIPYTTDVKQYIDRAVANAGGGGGTGGGEGEDIRYFTEFTMIDFHDINNYDNSELISAAQNNKIICIPFSPNLGCTGYYIPTYQCFTSGNDVLLTIKILLDGVEYIIENNDGSNFYISSIAYKTKIEYSYDTELIISVQDNILYLAQEELSSLVIYPDLDLYSGSTIRFVPSEDFVLTIPENTLWVNGVMPGIEPHVQYELSLTMDNNYSLLAVLIPFKPVE